MPMKSYRQALNEALHQEMARDPRVVIDGRRRLPGAWAPLGEDEAWGGIRWA